MKRIILLLSICPLFLSCFNKYELPPTDGYWVRIIIENDLNHNIFLETNIPASFTPVAEDTCFRSMIRCKQDIIHPNDYLCIVLTDKYSDTLPVEEIEEVAAQIPFEDVVTRISECVSNPTVKIFGVNNNETGEPLGKSGLVECDVTVHTEGSQPVSPLHRRPGIILVVYTIRASRLINN